MDLNFFTPVNYLNHDTSLFTHLKEAADNYFYYGIKKPRAYVLDIEGNSYKVQLVDCKPNLVSTALKIASLPTLILPLSMLFIKIAARAGRHFTVINPQSTERTAPFEILAPQKRKITFDRLAQEKRYTELFAKAGLDYSKATPLQKHVAFFVDQNGDISRSSMQTGFERLHLGKITSIASSIFVFNGLSLLTGKVNGVIRLTDIDKGKHLSDTGMFTKTGELDLAKFKIFQQFAKTNPYLITADELTQMEAANKARDKDLNGAEVGALASSGEFDLTLKLFADRFVVDENGKATPAITFDQLLKVYADGPLLFEEVAAK